MRTVTNPFITGGYISPEYLCDREQERIVVQKAIALVNRITSYEPLFESTLSLMTERQKEIHFAIAREMRINGITSESFIKKHGLQSASSVQAAIKQLLDKEIITVENNIYQIYDRFFGLWMARNYGTGYRI